jgi:thioredoxin 1
VESTWLEPTRLENRRRGENIPNERDERKKTISNVQPVTKNDFESKVLESSLPVVIDFWADWCAPCHRVSPILEDLAGDYAGRIRVAKVNVDEEVELAARYGVRAMPTFLFLRDGKVVDQLTGARPRSDFEARFEALLETSE